MSSKGKLNVVIYGWKLYKWKFSDREDPLLRFLPSIASFPFPSSKTSRLDSIVGPFNCVPLLGYIGAKLFGQHNIDFYMSVWGYKYFNYLTSSNWMFF